MRIWKDFVLCIRFLKSREGKKTLSTLISKFLKSALSRTTGFNESLNVLIDKFHNVEDQSTPTAWISFIKAVKAAATGIFVVPS